ncbi:C6 zinc finger protein [Colletotrichum karsti]|uniref:C6 zinc finger protein n=1 Tax=Colletotrichum karsti TaxID=1095194 RepID=A0A9P6I112_9PEZI|nr:C6 zinc finger protein [Colletotrichum karsti]KAF9874992.1 C6 zinc finger protein [Colletotrichum karsti]
MQISLQPSSSDIAISGPVLSQSQLAFPPADGDLNFVDLELIHNFTTSVYTTLSTDPLVCQMWRVSVVRLALKCDYVMRTLLSISALHLAHQQPERKEALVAKALLYHRIASREAMDLMSGLDERNAENLFLFSLLTIFFALASGRYLKESAVVWESAFPDWTFLLSGTCSLIKMLNARTYNGMLRPIINYATERFFTARGDSSTHPEALNSLRRLINDNCHDEALLNTYNYAIDELRHPLSLALYSGERGMDIMDMFIWKYFVAEDFLPLLKSPETNQEAVVIYAHFCIVLSRLEIKYTEQYYQIFYIINNMEWAKQTYNQQYERWVPWLEDIYLRWFTKDNKASYTTKDTLGKTKVTGVEQVDTLQDGVHNLAAGQVGQGGLLQPVGDLASKEGLNRAERQGKDDDGGYVPTAVPGSSAVNTAAGGIADGSSTVAGKTTEGVKGAGSYVGGLFGGSKKEQQK